MNKTELLATFECVAQETQSEIVSYLNNLAGKNQENNFSNDVAVLLASMRYTNEVVRKLIFHLAGE